MKEADLQRMSALGKGAENDLRVCVYVRVCMCACFFVRVWDGWVGWRGG